jgi:hypothetical protein
MGRIATLTPKQTPANKLAYWLAVRLFWLASWIIDAEIQIKRGLIMPEYTLIFIHTDIAEFISLVNQHLEQGWIPNGPHVVTVTPKGVAFSQSFTRVNKGTVQTPAIEPSKEDKK